MTSLRPVLVGYRLMRFGPYTCLPSICVQNLSVTHSSAVVWRLACTIHRPFFDLLSELLFDFSLPLGAGPLLLLSFTFLSAHFLIALISCHVTLPLCCNDSILLDLFRPAVNSFPQWLNMAIDFPTYGLPCPFCFSLRHPWPIRFLWNSLSLLLTLHSHGFLLTSLGFPGPIISFSSLGFMGLPLTPYFLCLHYFWACNGPFLLFYIVYCPWVCYFSLSRSL